MFWNNCWYASFMHLPSWTLMPGPTLSRVRLWPNTDGRPPTSTDPPVRYTIYSKLSRVVFLGLYSSNSLLFFLLPDRINHSFFRASHTQSYILPEEHLSQCFTYTRICLSSRKAPWKQELCPFNTCPRDAHRLQHLLNGQINYEQHRRSSKTFTCFSLWHRIRNKPFPYWSSTSPQCKFFPPAGADCPDHCREKCHCYVNNTRALACGQLYLCKWELQILRASADLTPPCHLPGP